MSAPDRANKSGFGIGAGSSIMNGPRAPTPPPGSGNVSTGIGFGSGSIPGHGFGGGNWQIGGSMIGGSHGTGVGGPR
jgi:hypothetical protein